MRRRRLPYRIRMDLHVLGFAAVLAANGCTSGSSPAPALQPQSPPVASGAQPAGPGARPGDPSPVEPACLLSSSTVRLRIDSGQTLPTGTGLEITNEGSTNDNYGPDGFDIIVSLRFRRGDDEDRHIPSYNDHRPQTVLGHCYRLLDASGATVLLEVSPLPSPQSTPGDVPALEGAGAPPPGAPACTETDDNGPLPGGKVVTEGCAPNELCVCEVRAGYSCRGHCAPIPGR